MSDWMEPGGESPQYPEQSSPYPPAPPYGQPVYPQPAYPAYPQPGYPQPGYPQPYPAGYPAPYPPGYSPQFPPPNSRPGMATAAAVLGYINAGLLILAGALLLFGASFVSDVEDASNSDTDYGTELALDGLLNMVAAGLLIAGAVMLSGRKPNGRVLFSVGGGIVLAETIYWLVRFSGVPGSGFVVWAVLFTALAVIALALVWTTEVNKWFRGEQR